MISAATVSRVGSDKQVPEMTVDDLRGDRASRAESEPGNALVGFDDNDDGANELGKGPRVAPAPRVEVRRKLGQSSLIGPRP